MLRQYYQYPQLEAGCDEAGRGALAGPVVAAAVILPENYTNTQLNDSKQLSEKARNALRKIIEHDAIAFAVAMIDNAEIDKLNILQASIKAMNNAVKQLTLQPQFLIIDGNRFHTDTSIPFQCIVKGDAKYMSIAAASILAKTYRDEFMVNISEKYPYYQWKKNKGYPTKEHRNAIKTYGPCTFHRKSFTLIPQQLEFDF